MKPAHEAHRSRLCFARRAGVARKQHAARATRPACKEGLPTPHLFGLFGRRRVFEVSEPSLWPAVTANTGRGLGTASASRLAARADRSTKVETGFAISQEGGLIERSDDPGGGTPCSHEAQAAEGTTSDVLGLEAVERQ